MFKAVIFDWDETLARSKDVAVQSFKKALAELKIDVSDEFIEEQMGKSARKILLETLKTSNKQYDEAKIDDLLQKRIKAEIELSSKVKLYEGAIELLEELNGKTKIGLATMNDEPVIIHLLKQKRISEYFDVVLSADDVEESKPNPQIFLLCANKLNMKPKDCVVIEDSLFGVKAAKSAGMSCIAVTSGAYEIEELEKEKPDLILNSLKEKKRILSFILH